MITIIDVPLRILIRFKDKNFIFLQQLEIIDYSVVRIRKRIEHAKRIHFFYVEVAVAGQRYGSVNKK